MTDIVAVGTREGWARTAAEDIIVEWMLRRPCHAVPCSRRDGWNRNGGCIVVDGGWIVGGACSRGWSAAAISKSDHTQTSPSLSALSVCTHCSLPFALALHLTSHCLLFLYYCIAGDSSSSRLHLRRRSFHSSAGQSCCHFCSSQSRRNAARCIQSRAARTQ